MRTAIFLLTLTAATAVAQQYDGNWAGTTGQGKTITFTIANSNMTKVAFGGTATAVGCTTNFTTQTDFTTPRSMTFPTFTINGGTSTPGGTSFSMTGTFASSTSVNGNISFNLFAIPGVPGSCSASGSTSWTATRPGGGPAPGGTVASVFAVVGSTAGSFGSFFKTSVQLHNPGPTAMTGKLVFHPANSSGSDSDPSLSYNLSPYQTISYNDLLPEMARSGTGSLDLVTMTGSAPLTAMRIYNDAGDKGTSGMGIDPIPTGDVLKAGQTAVLIAPADPAKFRFNIGVRTLSSGVSMQITVRDKDGVSRNTTTKTYDPTFFTQVAASAIAGIDLQPSDSIAFAINSGSAIIYGAATDNTTQDPTLQYAKKLF